MARRRSEERREFWQDLIAKQATSGLSIKAFCEKSNVSQPSFYAWRRRLESDAALQDGPQAPTFVPLPPIFREAKFEVRLPNGVSVSVPQRFDPSGLQRLLEVASTMENSDA